MLSHIDCIQIKIFKLNISLIEKPLMDENISFSLLIILGDFNKANLSRELPKYRQHVTYPTRDSNILDHCYTIIKDAYHSVP